MEKETSRSGQNSFKEALRSVNRNKRFRSKNGWRSKRRKDFPTSFKTTIGSASDIVERHPFVAAEEEPAGEQRDRRRRHHLRPAERRRRRPLHHRAPHRLHDRARGV